MANEGKSGFPAGFVIGAIVGAALAYFATQEDARDLLLGKAREAQNIAMDATGDLRGRVDEVASQFQTNASDLYERGRSVIDQARSTINSAVEEGKAQAEKLHNDLSGGANG